MPLNRPHVRTARPRALGVEPLEERVVPAADIEAVLLTWNPLPGGGATFAYNNTEALTAPATVEFYWSSTGGFDGSATPAGAGGAPLASGLALEAGPHSVAVPGSSLSAPADRGYYLVAVARPGDGTSDENPNNNEAAKVVAPGDLVVQVQAKTLPASPERGRPYEVYLEATSGGPIPTPPLTLTWREVLDPKFGSAISRGAVVPIEGEQQVVVPEVAPGRPPVLVRLGDSRTLKWDWIPDDNPIEQFTRGIPNQLAEILRAESLGTVIEIGQRLAPGTIATYAGHVLTFTSFLSAYFTGSDAYDALTAAQNTYPYLTDPNGPAVTVTGAEVTVQLGIPTVNLAAYGTFVSTVALSTSMIAAAAGLARLGQFQAAGPLAFMGAVGIFVVANVAYDQAKDPPDFDYTVAVEPEPVAPGALDTLPAGPERNAAAVVLEWASLKQAEARARNKADGATLAGDAAWTSTQLAASAGFAARSAALEARLLADANVAGRVAAVQSTDLPALLSTSGEALLDLVAPMLAALGVPAFGAPALGALLADAAATGDLPIATPAESLRVANLASHLAGYDDLGRAVDVRTRQLGLLPRPLTPEEQAGLESLRAAAPAVGEAWTPEGQARVDAYLAELRRLAVETNNLDAVRPALEAAIAAAVGYAGAEPPPLPPVYRPAREVAVGALGWAVLYGADGSPRQSLAPFGETFFGEVRTAAADFNGDGVADLVVGTGPGQATRVRVLDGATGAELFALDPFEAAFTGGVFVAAGDLTGDGKAELVVTPDEGGGPRVRVFTYDGVAAAHLADFFGILGDVNFRGGARAAVGDVTGDGVGDLLVAAGFGGGPRVATFDGAKLARDGRLPDQGEALWESWKPFGDLAVFEPTLRNGVFVAAGDLDGDGFADLIAGGGPGGAPRVFSLSGRDLLSNRQTQVANFFAGDVSSRGGVRVAVKDLDGDARADLVTGPGGGADLLVRAYAGAEVRPDGAPGELFSLESLADPQAGVFVG